MFKVRDKNWNVFLVYAVNFVKQETTTSTEFLIFYYGKWVWIDAKDYVPLEEDSKE